MAKENSTKTSTKAVNRTTVAAKVGHGSSSTAPQPTHEAVAVRAYEIYLREGCPDGRHLDHWTLAEAELGV
jgi:hypothetical protein